MRFARTTDDPLDIPKHRLVVEAYVIAFGWGHIKDHWQDCEDCDGTGKDEPDAKSITRS